MPDRQASILESIMDTTLSTTVCGAVQVPAWARYASLYVPARDNAAITLSAREDATVTADTDLIPTTTTSWYGVVDEAEASAVLAAGTTATWVDITNYIRALPKDCWVRPVAGAAQDPGITLRFNFRGA